jgi:hypothetical protein
MPYLKRDNVDILEQRKKSKTRSKSAYPIIAYRPSCARYWKALQPQGRDFVERP